MSIESKGEAKSPLLGDPATVARLTEFFSKENSILSEVQTRVAEDTGQLCDVVFPLLYAIADSNQAFMLLANQGVVRGSYVMARASLEGIVNTAFILCEGDAAADRARRHAQQKAFRDLDREIDINGEGFRIMCAGNPEPDAELHECLAMFTGKKDREITTWTDENVKERIEKIAKKHGFAALKGLMFGLFSIYRHSSEIVHGSLFGAQYSLGLTLPGRPRTHEELEHFLRSNISTLLWFLGRSIDSLVFVVEREMGLTGFYERSQKLVKAYHPRGDNPRVEHSRIISPR